MSRIKSLKEHRGAKIAELETLRTGAANRAFTAAERTKFDAVENEIKGISADIEREERATGLATSQVSVDLGLSKKERRQYSLLKAVRSLASGKPLDGLEAEASAAEAQRVGRDPSGVFVPAEVLATRAIDQRDPMETRANAANVASDGGYLVAQTIDTSNLVPYLRNQAVTLSLGARVISGLTGDVTIPRVTGASSVYWVSETGTITGSSATLGQIQIKPKRVGVTVNYSKQLVAQSSLDVESFVRDDIMASLAVDLDRVALNGAGATEPLGILNLASGDRATSVTFGATATWAKAIAFESNVGTANALGLAGSQYAYVSTPATRGAWKGIAKASNYPQFIWDGNTVNGYNAVATNQIPSDKVIFGQFSQVIFGVFAGIDVTVDPLSLATSGQIKLTVQQFLDCVIRQGKAFSISTDSGNQ